jgi:hypothetical protein
MTQIGYFLPEPLVEGCFVTSNAIRGAGGSTSVGLGCLSGGPVPNSPHFAFSPTLFFYLHVHLVELFSHSPLIKVL